MKLNIIESTVLYILVIGCILYGVYWVIKNSRQFGKEIQQFVTKDHILIIGLSQMGYKFAKDLAAEGRKVVVISEGANSTHADKLKKLGVQLIHTAKIDENALQRASLFKAMKVIIVTETDERNISLTNFITRHLRNGKTKRVLQLLVHITDWDVKSLLADYVGQYSALKNADLRVFDTDQESARLIFDKYTPYRFVNDETNRNREKAICVIGLNKIARAFIIENSIMSHFPDSERLAINVIDTDAKQKVQELLYKFPFIEEYIELRAVEMKNAFFAGTEAWGGDFVKNIGNVDVAYVFGEEDATIINVAVHFKQFLYNGMGNVRKVPVIACLPEKSEVFELLEIDGGTEGAKSILNTFNDDLMIHTVRRFTDTLDIHRIIDSSDSLESLAKAVNYFYSIKYEFDYILNHHFKKNSNHQFLEGLQQKYLAFDIKNYSPLEQLETMVINSLMSYTKSSEFRLKKFFGINERWASISERNKESNRYVARDMNAKIHMLKSIGAKELSVSFIEENAHKLFPLVHQRWAAEKQAGHFAYGPLPKNDAGFKKLLKNILKVHDMLVPYKELSEFEKDKDKDMFLLIPLMVKIRKAIK